MVLAVCQALEVAELPVEMALAAVEMVVVEVLAAELVEVEVEALVLRVAVQAAESGPEIPMLTAAAEVAALVVAVVVVVVLAHRPHLSSAWTAPTCETAPRQPSAHRPMSAWAAMTVGRWWSRRPPAAPCARRTRVAINWFRALCAD
jgi:hypothetical protein